MNTQLASVLQEIGRSPNDLVNALNKRLKNQGARPYHRTTAFKWVKDDSRPRGLIPEIVCSILSEWHGRKISLADVGWEGNIKVPAVEASSAPWGASSVRRAIYAELGEDVDRRIFMAQSGMDLASLAYPWLLEPVEGIEETVAGRRINEATVAEINVITGAQRRMDDAIGGGTLLAAVREQLRVTIRLVLHASFSAEVGKKLYSALAEQARLASWLAYDNNQHGLAQRYTSMALRAAHVAEDRLAGANILGFAACQAGGRGDAVACETFARTALSGGRGLLTPAVEGSLNARLCTARARQGDADGAVRAFDAAQNLLGRVDWGDEPNYMYWFTDADLHGIAGKACMMTGRHHDAIEHLTEAVAGTPDDLVRDKAIWLSSLAAGYVSSGDLSQGHETAEQALVLLRGDLESERVFEMFGKFCETVREHDPAAADDFHERLVSYSAAGDEFPA